LEPEDEQEDSGTQDETAEDVPAEPETSEPETEEDAREVLTRADLRVREPCPWGKAHSPYHDPLRLRFGPTTALGCLRWGEIRP